MIGAGVQFAAAIIVFLYVGRWLDQRLGSRPWLTMVGVFVGATGGFYSMYRTLIASEKKSGTPRTGGGA
jgi:F0F1-type ATP synthase assembly protein I